MRELAMKKRLKPVPKFKTEAEERDFWESHDTTEYFDLRKARRARFPNLKPSTTSISLQLTQDVLDRIKVVANFRDVPYDSLIKVWLSEKLEQVEARRRKKNGRKSAA